MANILTSLFGLRKTDKTSAQSAEANDNATYFNSLIKRLEEELRESGAYYDEALSKYESGKAIMAFDLEKSLEIFMYCLPLYFKSAESLRDQWQADTSYDKALSNVIRVMLKRRLPFDRNQLDQVLDKLCKTKDLFYFSFPVNSFLTAVERYLKEHGLDDLLKAKLTKLAKRIESPSYFGADERRQVERIRVLARDDHDLSIPVQPGEAWSDQLLADLGELPEQQLTHWLEVLFHCQGAKASRPTKKWLKSATTLLENVGHESFRKFCIDWFRLLGKLRTQVVEQRREWEPDRNQLFIENNADILRGLVWMGSLAEDADMARVLCQTGIVCFKKIPNHGAKSVRVGNAVIYFFGRNARKNGPLSTSYS